MRIVLNANPHYRRRAATLKPVATRYGAEVASQWLLTAKGDMGIATNQIKGLTGNYDITATKVSLKKPLTMSASTSTSPFQDVSVRQAMHCLVDHDGMVNSFLEGNKSYTRNSGQPACGLCLRKMPINSIQQKPRRCWRRQATPMDSR